MKKLKKAYLTFLFITLTHSIINANNSTKPIQSPTPWITSRIDFLKQMPKNGIVAEIGVQKGDFSELILKYAQPKVLYLIDCWKTQKAPETAANVPQNNLDNLYKHVINKFKNDPRVIIIREFTPKVTALFKDNFFDWVYIDADHRYEAIKKDLTAWFKKVKIGGFLAGHDYGYHPRMKFGVVPAVNEFIAQYQLNIDYLSTDPFASYAIKKNTHRFQDYQ